jgi:hypothetical protein
VTVRPTTCVRPQVWRAQLDRAHRDGSEFLRRGLTPISRAVRVPPVPSQRSAHVQMLFRGTTLPPLCSRPMFEKPSTRFLLKNYFSICTVVACVQKKGGWAVSDRVRVSVNRRGERDHTRTRLRATLATPVGPVVVRTDRSKMREQLRRASVRAWHRPEFHQSATHADRALSASLLILGRDRQHSSQACPLLLWRALAWPASS